jgi:hypothetical protein
MHETTHPESHHSRTTPWIWAWLASIMALLAVGVLVTPAAAPVPDLVRWPLLAGAVAVGGASTLLYIRADRDGGASA